MIKLPLYQSSGAEMAPCLISIRLTVEQYWLVREGLDLLYDEETTREHFDKTDLDDSLKEADDIIDLINYLKSCSRVLAPEGGEG